MSDNKEKEDKPIVAKTAVDLQRLKLMKLMKNPEKPVVLPERPKAKNTPTVPEFVRNVMGSSAGAGSGEFHVYRHLRRKEYARQKFIQEKGRKESLDEEYHRKLEENRILADEATAKKRAKRLKRKQKWKQNKRLKPKKKDEPKEHNTTEDESSDETESENVNAESVTDNVQMVENSEEKCESVDGMNQSIEQLDSGKVDKNNANDDQPPKEESSTKTNSESTMETVEESSAKKTVLVEDT